MNEFFWNFNKNNLIIFLILLAGFLLISAVGANELNDYNLTEYNSNEFCETVQENTINTFDDLSQIINNAPENQTLVLDRDYTYVDGDKHGIVISKPITIDGSGHTLDGNKSSRILNITSDNVVLKNINFINGNALGFYGKFYGGGAIYWSGSNGNLINCTFTSNSATGLEVDPFDPPEVVYYGDDGISWVVYKTRPMGASTNQGGAITWIGSNGTVDRCIFRQNGVSYPNAGGAIIWRGNDGVIRNSEFYDNNAFVGSAIYWSGENGLVTSSKFIHTDMFKYEIYWTGKTGNINNSIIVSQNRNEFVCYGSDLKLDYNFWGDTLQNTSKIKKDQYIRFWFVLRDDLNVSDMTVINDSFVLMVNPNVLLPGVVIIPEIIGDSSKVDTYVDVEIPVKNDEKVMVKTKIITKNVHKKLKSSGKFKIKVLNSKGNAFAKQLVKIKFRGKTYKLKTNKKGIAIFKIPKNLKKGKYTIKTTVNGKTKINKIIVKK